MKSLNEKELREVSKCSSCKKGVMHTGLPLFWCVKVSRYGIKMNAVKKQSGLEMMMGGNMALAQIFSPEEEMAQMIAEELTLTFCENCMLQHNTRLMALVEDT